MEKKIIQGQYKGDLKDRVETYLDKVLDDYNSETSIIIEIIKV